MVDRAPGYDIYNKKDTPHVTKKEAKLDCADYPNHGIKFKTEYRNECRNIYKTKCQLQYVEGHQCSTSVPCMKNQSTGHKGKCAMRYKFECKQENQINVRGNI